MESNEMSLSVSIISSFCTSGLFSNDEFSNLKQHVAKSFPDQTLDLDAYVFMEGDTCFLSDAVEAGRRLPALHFLGSEVGENLDKITQCLLQKNGNRAPIALTTFLPEISQYVLKHEDQQIIAAIVGIFKLAIEIGVSSGQTPVVQMVAGNMLDRVDQPPQQKERSKETTSKKEPQRNRFFIVEADENASYEMVLRRLSECFEILSSELQGQAKKLEALEQLRIAFELEPGPLYLLDGPMSLVRFCNLIENHPDPAITKHVGFNLDVAHWWLKNIRPEFLEQPLDYLLDENFGSKNDPVFNMDPPKIRERIFHSHISGHSRRAHFGDISLTMMTPKDRESYIEWLAALNSLSKEKDSSFSGYVSLEFEAARSRTCVANSVCELLRMVDEIVHQ